MTPQDVQAQIAKDLDIENLPMEEQEKLIEEFGTVAIQASSIAVLEKLPAEKRDQFAALLEAQDAAGAKALLDAEVPDHEAIARQAVAAEIARFKEFQKSL